MNAKSDDALVKLRDNSRQIGSSKYTTTSYFPRENLINLLTTSFHYKNTAVVNICAKKKKHWQLCTFKIVKYYSKRACLFYFMTFIFIFSVNLNCQYTIERRKCERNCDANKEITWGLSALQIGRSLIRFLMVEADDIPRKREWMVFIVWITSLKEEILFS